MIVPQNFDLNGESYQLVAHTGFTALNLQAKVSALYTALFRENKDLDDVGLFQALTEKMGSLPEADLKWILETTLNQTTVTTAGKKNVTLKDSDAIAAHFEGRSFADLYGLLFKVWELEKLGPFGLMEPAAQAGA